MGIGVADKVEESAQVSLKIKYGIEFCAVKEAGYFKTGEILLWK